MKVKTSGLFMVTALVALVAVAGCTENRSVNAATGAVLGGAAANAVGANTLGTVAGAAAGAVVGANVNR